MNVPKGRFSSIHVKHAVISAGLDVCWSSLGPQRRKERKKETFTSVSTRYMASWPHISYIIHGCIITPQPYTHILTPAYTAALHSLTQRYTNCTNLGHSDDCSRSLPWCAATATMTIPTDQRATQHMEEEEEEEEEGRDACLESFTPPSFCPPFCPSF